MMDTDELGREVAEWERREKILNEMDRVFRGVIVAARDCAEPLREEELDRRIRAAVDRMMDVRRRLNPDINWEAWV